MPFKSEKQRRFMWAEHPDIAKRWADESKGKDDRNAKRAVKALKEHKSNG